MADKSIMQHIMEILERFEAGDIRTANLERDFAELSEKFGTLSRQMSTESKIEVPPTSRPESLKTLGIGKDQ